MSKLTSVSVDSVNYTLGGDVDLSSYVTNSALGSTLSNYAPKGNYVTKSEIFNLVYPVGSFYISINSTNPGSLFGGTWSQVQGKFLLAASDSYTAGSTGGEATHTLTTSELPNFQFRIPHVAYYDTCALTNVTESRTSMDKEGAYNTTSNSGWHNISVGANSAHNNMPPYLAVYIWQRTA